MSNADARRRHARLVRDVVTTQDKTQDGVEHVVRTGFSCNQRCPYCYASLSGGKVSLAEIRRSLDAIAAKGPEGRWVSFSGGEPAADPRLPAIVRLARRKGLSGIELQTNAVFLSRPGLAASLVLAGVERFFVSFPSFKPRVYDELTGSRRQYPLAVKGLASLLALPGAGSDFRVCVNIVMNRLNFRDLPAHVGFLARLGPARLSVFFSLMNSIGHERAPSLALDLRGLRRPLNAALSACREAGIAVEKFLGPSAPPVCLVAGPGGLASSAAIPQGDVGVYPGDFKSQDPDGPRRLHRAKSSACKTCRFDARCAGVSFEYARLFGVGALGCRR